jgi:hypothetical protein
MKKVNEIELETELLEQLEDLKRKLQDASEDAKDANRLKKEFWRIIGKIKRLPEVSDEIAGRAAEIHSLLFIKRTVLDFRNGALVFSGFLVLTYSLFFWIALHAELKNFQKSLLALFVEFPILYLSFLTGRCLAGVISGIKFKGFYRYNPFELGLRLDYYSYLRAGQQRRVLLFGIPILWEHLILLSQLIVLLKYNQSLIWIPGIFLISNLPFSYLIHKKLKTGELHRFLREMKILREIEQK